MARQSRRARRGQPLVVLAALVLGWVGVRSVLWQDLDWPKAPIGALLPLASVQQPTGAVEPAEQPSPAEQLHPFGQHPAALPHAGPLPLPPTTPAPAPLLPVYQPAVAGSATGGPVQVAGHQLAWLASVGSAPVPPFVRDRLSATDRSAGLLPEPARVARLGPASAAAPARRWSLDSWVLLRQGGSSLTASGPPSPGYGASQAGAVLRYRLAPASAHRPAAYLRASSALSAPRGEEAALGLSVRPVARLPVSVQAEARVTRFAAETVVRPAVGVVTEFNRVPLPAGLDLELYGQAGYVGGRNATAFIDGQARVDRQVAQIGKANLRVGAGAWGGAQRGASRLDLGPTAMLDFAVGTGQARLAADWRIQVAGNAAPKSGPAVTLSAGF